MLDINHTKFKKFHTDNPEIYKLFKEFTFTAINNGHKKLSSEMIINRIRWDKINNNYKPFYSRMFMSEHPEYKEFFYKRASKADLELHNV